MNWCELVAIPQILDLVAVRGNVVSIDAIGCQRAVAATPLARGADYLLAQLPEKTETAN